MARGQTLTDGRIAPFSYITHATAEALKRYFSAAQGATLSTGLALYMSIAYLLSIEKRDGLHEGGIEKTREEIGEPFEVSATNVTRYAQHLVSAEVLELEQLVAGGANLYRWTLVDPPFHAPLQIGEAGGAPLQIGDRPHQNGEAPLQIGEAYIDRRRTTKKTTTPCSPPLGDDPVLQEIFDFWKIQTSRNGSTRFSRKRQRAIRTRLRDGHTPEELCRAILGCAGSDWHMKRGKHSDRDGQPANDLTFILRDTENVERFGEMASEGPAKSSPFVPVSESAAATATWGEAKVLVRASVSPSTFDLWIAPLEAAGERDGVLVLVDTKDQGDWSSRRYSQLIRDALGKLEADYTDVEIVNEKSLELEAA